jgi:hypothetical protein
LAVLVSGGRRSLIVTYCDLHDMTGCIHERPVFRRPEDHADRSYTFRQSAEPLSATAGGRAVHRRPDCVLIEVGQNCSEQQGMQVHNVDRISVEGADRRGLWNCIECFK